MGSEAEKKKLGEDFDYIAAWISENAALHGVCYGFWNLDRVQMFTALEYFPLNDELTGDDMAGIRFWRIDDEKPTNIQVYEPDGWTWYVQPKNSTELNVYKPKQPYVNKVWKGVIGTQRVGGDNYPALPIVAMKANKRGASELTNSIKNKIDLMDYILSGFGDSALRTKVIYWVLQGFSGTLDDFSRMKDKINASGIIAPDDEGTASANVVDLPFGAVEFALDKLRKEIYSDFMGMDVSEVMGGSLTNVAIMTNAYNLSLKASDFEWQCFSFVRRILKLQGIETENIKFKRQAITNDFETTQMVMMAASYLDRQTIIEKLPFIAPDEVDNVLDRIAAEQLGVEDEDEQSAEGLE